MLGAWAAERREPFSPPPRLLGAARPALGAPERAALDDAAALARHTEWTTGADGVREACSAFVLTGLHCAACAGTIEHALHQVDGVRRADVHGASARARVVWDPTRVRASDLVDAVRRAGYDALPATREDARLARRREARRTLWQLFVAAFCMMQVMMVTTPVYVAAPGEIPADQLALLRWTAWVLTLPVMLFSCGPFFHGAWRALRAGRIGMDVPVALGMGITFVAGTAATFDPAGPFGHEPYLDSLAMFATFLLAGRWLERRARHRAVESLEALLHRLPEAAERLDDAGGATLVAVAQLRVGDRVRVAAGQAFPGDARVVDGHALADEAMLTGESRPVSHGAGDTVIGGSVNVGGPVVVSLLRLGDDTRHGAIVRLLERALSDRPAAPRLADRIAGPFLAGVLVLAAGAAAAWGAVDPARAVSVAVAVLIVTCPCALSLAAPVAWLAAASALARRGVLVQRLDALEALAATDVACLDKTGTLTADTHALAVMEGDDPEARRHAAALAALSRHPLSVALAAALPPATVAWHEVREVAGQGLEGVAPSGRTWRLGAPAWAGGVPAGDRPQVVCAASGGPALRFEFDEVLRDDAAEAVAALQAQGLAVRVLSGDTAPSARRIAARVGIGDVIADATPDAKLAAVAALQAAGRRVLVVGDGLNDGPVLARADVSVAMGHGSAIAQQRADLVVLGSRLAEVPQARALALRMQRIVRQNLAWAAAYNATCVPLALVGWMPPWAAGAGMALSSLAVVANALRLAR